MEDPTQNLSLEKESLKKIADELDVLQARENNGRGVSCLRSVVFYLKQGDEQSAKAVIVTDSDKMRNYPEIWSYLLEKGLREYNKWTDE